MKKIMICALALAAMTMTGCGWRTEESQTKGDSIVSEMRSLLEAGDAEGLATAFVRAQETLISLATQGKREEAVDCIDKLKVFVVENSDSLRELVGSRHLVNDVAETLRGIPSSIGGKLEEMGIAIRTKAEREALQGKEQLDQSVEDGKQKAADAVNEALEDARQKANDAVDRLEEELKDRLEQE